MNEDDLRIVGLSEITSCTNPTLLYVSYFYQISKYKNPPANMGDIQRRYVTNKHTPLSVVVDILKNPLDEYIPLAIAEDANSSRERLLAVMNSPMSTSTLALIKSMCKNRNLTTEDLYNWAVRKQELFITEYLFITRSEEMNLLTLKLTDLRYSELEALSIPMKHKLLGLA